MGIVTENMNHKMWFVMGKKEYKKHFIEHKFSQDDTHICLEKKKD